jgi:4-aminobutyrate aminotransferase-like enzyme
MNISYLQSKGILCVADEVQTGFGRSGTHFWAYQSYGDGYLKTKNDYFILSF